METFKSSNPDYFLPVLFLSTDLIQIKVEVTDFQFENSYQINLIGEFFFLVILSR